MEDAREAKIVVAEAESLAMLFGEGIFRGRRPPPPDLVLVDTATRGIDAYAIMRRLRNDWRLRRVPVVFLCASEAEGERAMSGADRPNAYLVKPISRQAFAEVVRQVRNWTLRLDLPEDGGYRMVRWPNEFAAARA
jgi:CheY-like chemotaxis protein